MTDPRRRTLRTIALCIGLLLAADALIVAQGPPPAAAQDPQAITDAAIEQARKQLAADTALDADTRQKASSWLDEASANLVRATAAAERTTRLRAEAAGAASEIETDRAVLQIPAREARPPSAATPIPDLESLLAAERLRQAAAEEEVTQLQAKSKSLAEARTAAATRLEELGQKRAASQQQDSTMLTEGVPAAVAVAQQLRLRSELQAIDAEIAELKTLQSNGTQLTDLYQARSLLAQRRAEEIGKRISALQEALNDQRVVAALQLRSAMKRVADSTPPVFDGYAQQILRDAEANLESVRALRDAQQSRQQTDARRTALDSRFAETRKRIAIVGLTEAMGLELRRVRREQLDDLDQIRRAAKSRRAQLVTLYEKRFAVEDDLTRLSDPAAAAQELVSATVPQAAEDQRAALVASARELVDSRRSALTALRDGYEALTSELLALDSSQAQLAAVASEAASFVDERVLWIASSPPVWRPNLADLRRGALELIECWTDAAISLKGLVFHAGAAVLASIGLVLLLLSRRFRRALKKAGEIAGRRTTVRILPTVEALGWSIALALPLPTILLAGWLCLDRSGDSPATAAALRNSAAMLFELLLLWQVCAPAGLGASHFGWPVDRLTQIRRQLRWLAPILTVSLFLATTINELPNDEWRGSVGRWSVVVPAASLAWFLRGMVRQNRGAFAGSSLWEGMGAWARWIVAVILVGIPTALCLLALAGYTFTANSLYSELVDTLTLLFLVVLGRALVLRILLLSRRQIVIKNTRERLRQAQAAAAGNDSPLDAATVEAAALDLAAVDQSARQLMLVAVWVVLAIGTWRIWADTLPAIRVFDSIPLWSETVATTETVKNAAGEDVAQVVQRVQPVTLANLLGALALAFLTWIGARNVGGFLEIAVLQRTALRAGERYAITSLVRYLIVLVGAIAAFSALGIGWSQIQWLVAGVSVGLGFGLQEIFANFVSGVILLFERPVRVGDYVTVGGTDGIVTRIQMRATTVRDWDRHELVIPNKDFVTQRVINWSLSDTIVRIVVQVGVAYGSDPEQVRRLLMDAAVSVPVVIRDPEPTAIFRGFGDNALNFELRGFIASMDDWINGMNGLHDAVARELGQAGIEIAFPQRDLHVRSIGPLREILSSPRRPADQVTT